jgi:hypothetical protein
VASHRSDKADGSRQNPADFRATLLTVTAMSFFAPFSVPKTKIFENGKHFALMPET